MHIIAGYIRIGIFRQRGKMYNSCIFIEDDNGGSADGNMRKVNAWGYGEALNSVREILSGNQYKIQQDRQQQFNPNLQAGIGEF